MLLCCECVSLIHCLSMTLMQTKRVGINPIHTAYANIGGICAQFKRFGHVRELKEDIIGS